MGEYDFFPHFLSTLAQMLTRSWKSWERTTTELYRRTNLSFKNHPRPLGHSETIPTDDTTPLNRNSISSIKQPHLTRLGNWSAKLHGL
jgi:hypothetical protein